MPITPTSWLGAWTPGTQYYAGDLVFRNGSSWLALLGNIGVDPFTDSGNNWALFAQAGVAGATGPQGASGQNTSPTFRWRGDFDPSQQYYVFDCVGYSNSAFVCTVAPPLGTTPLTTPDINSPVANPYWSRMARGQPLVWQGTWNNTAVYFGNDIVTYQNGTYVALLQNTNALPSDSDSWALMLTSGASITLGSDLSPTSASTAGTTGQIVWDSGHIYVCTAGGIAGAATWKAAALTTV